MEVILRKDIKGLGYENDVVKVKPGYFRNFLSPKGFAQTITPGLLKAVIVKREKMLLEKQKLIDQAKEVLKKLEGSKLKIKKKVSKNGKLYGAITEDDVIKAIVEKENVKLEKEFIKMNHIKELGEHKIEIVLGEDLKQEIVLVVEAEE